MFWDSSALVPLLLRETFICLDERLRAAARREGFALLPRHRPS